MGNGYMAVRNLLCATSTCSHYSFMKVQHHSSSSALIRPLNLPGTLILDCPNSKTMRNKFLFLMYYLVLGSKPSVSLNFWWLASDP